VGRPFVIEGNPEITGYPWLGVRTGAAHLDNLPAVGGAPLVEWQSIVVAAKVLPLLTGEIVADRIRLQGPRLHLRRDAQGRGNWEDLGPRKPTLSGPAALSSAASASSVAPAGSVASASSMAQASSAASIPSVASGRLACNQCQWQRDI
jgi:AsmA protein